MPLVNPGQKLYFNMDIENLDVPTKKFESKGLLAPVKNMMKESEDDRTKQPAFTVGQHMLLFRKERERIKDV